MLLGCGWWRCVIGECDLIRGFHGGAVLLGNGIPGFHGGPVFLGNLIASG